MLKPNRSTRRAIESHNRKVVVQAAAKAYTPPMSLQGRVGSWLMHSIARLLPAAEIREIMAYALIGGVAIGGALVAGVMLLLDVLKVPR
jgi:uncharacterized membrane protein (DUF441 family)